MILVGGKGKRLGKITKDTPKPLVQIQDSVFLDYLLDYIQKKIKNINKIYFIAGYLGKMIEERYKRINDFDQFQFLIEKKIEGTGRAIFKFKNIFKIKIQ